MAEDDEPMTTRVVAEHVRVSYRQLDYWVRSGYLAIHDERPGSGNRRIWTTDEIRTAEAFAALVHAGVDPAHVAEALPTLAVGDLAFVISLDGLTVSGRLA